MEYRYQLAHYTRTADWLVCPNCGQRQLVPYVDSETGDILDPSCGRCNRESNCAYHLTPREFFKQNPGARPQGDAWRQEPDWMRKPTHNSSPAPQPQRQAAPICELPKEIVAKTILMEPRSNFVKFLDTMFDPLIVEGLVFMYNLGRGDLLSERHQRPLPWRKDYTVRPHPWETYQERRRNPCQLGASAIQETWSHPGRLDDDPVPVWRAPFGGISRQARLPGRGRKNGHHMCWLYDSTGWQPAERPSSAIS